MEKIEKVLSFGLPVILVNRPAAESVTGIFAVGAGLKYENETNNGISHFLEHMTFKGTKRFPTSLDLAIQVEGRGGYANAFTSQEVTAYYIGLPYQHADSVYDFISDILLNSLFKPEEVAIEKGPVTQELMMQHDDHEEYIGSVVWPELLYGNQPAGWTIIGRRDNIENFSRKQLIDYQDKLYRSINSVFCVVGRLTESPDETFAKIENYFQKMKKGSPKLKKPPVVESQFEPAVKVVARMKVQQSHLMLGVRTYDVNHPKRHALRVLQTILGGNSSSRMFVAIREHLGLAYYIGTAAHLQTDVGDLFTYAGLDKDKLILGTEAMIEEYRKICDTKVSEDELRRAKDYINGIRQITIESTAPIAKSMAVEHVETGKAVTPEEKREKINAVTAKDIQEVAQDIFKDENLNLAIVGPHQGIENKLFKILKF